MPESRLRTLSIEFAVKILNLVKDLKNQRYVRNLRVSISVYPCSDELTAYAKIPPDAGLSAFFS